MTPRSAITPMDPGPHTPTFNTDRLLILGRYNSIFWTDVKEPIVVASTAKSPPTGRVMDVLATLADSPAGRTSAEIAKICGISTSTCALVLAELEGRGWVTRHDDRRYGLGSGCSGWFTACAGSFRCWIVAVRR